MVKGAIIINPFLTPLESVHQAERLTEEFSLLGVSVKTVTDKSEIYTELKELDFAVYLDKDKYQSQILENAGVRLFNSHNAIRVCDDKAETIIALKNQNLNIPKTVFGGLCYRNDLKINALWAEKIAEQLNFPVVVKESFGSMGKGVYIANDINELIAVMEKVKLKPHIFQQYIGGKKGVDVRVIVIGGKAVAAMERRNDGDFRSNVAQGGVGVKIDLPLEFKNAAEKCAQVLGLDYCGVDLLYGVSGEPYVCEVNSNAFFSGIEKATNVNVAKLYAEHILKIVKGK